MMGTERHRSPNARVPTRVGTRPQERLAALFARHMRVQGAIVVIMYVLALAWLQIPQVPGVLRAFVLWALTALLLGLLILLARRSARALIAVYRSATGELEQELHDRSFREATATILDKLTGVHSYEYLDSRIKEEIERCRRHGHGVTLILVDLLQFQRVNQQYGRAMGNQVLRRFALNVLRPIVRSSDVVARYGGDEFAVLLPETDYQQATAVARRIAEAAARGTILSDGQRLPLPITMGLASYPKDAATAEELVRATEWALMEAKVVGALPGQAPEKV